MFGRFGDGFEIGGDFIMWWLANPPNVYKKCLYLLQFRWTLLDMLFWGTISSPYSPWWVGRQKNDPTFGNFRIPKNCVTQAPSGHTPLQMVPVEVPSDDS